MSQYLAIPATEQLPEEFEGPVNQLIARQIAEKKYGSRIRIFVEITNGGLPPGFVETRPGVWESTQVSPYE